MKKWTLGPNVHVKTNLSPLKSLEDD